MTKLYKFLRTDLKSDSGNISWKIGEWRHEDDLNICHHGFHGSKKILDALSYVKGEVLAVVEVKGKSIKQSDKECWSDMRVIHAYEWTKEESVRLAIFAAEQVIGIFEKKYPNDKRPREAIEAAKKYLENPSEAAARAAWAAAWAAAAAARAAWAAAAAARAAAWAVEAAARAAAEAWAEAAARAEAWARRRGRRRRIK